MKRKRLVSPTLSNVALSVAEIKNPNAPQTKKEFFEQEAREQRETETRRQEQELRPLREMQKRTNAVVLAERDRQRKWLFVSPSDFLTEHCTLAPARVNGTPETIAAEIREAFNEFRINLEHTGATLRPIAVEKLRRVVEQNPTVDLRVVSNWEIVYRLCEELGVFADGDLTVKEQPTPVEKQAETRPTFADVEKINIGAGSDSERLAKTLVNDLMTAEIQPIANRWYVHLYDDYQFVPTPFQHQWIMKWFVRNGANPLIHESWNSARRTAVDAGVFPDHMLTRDEILSQTIETGGSLASLNFDEKRALKNRLQRMSDPS